MLRAKTRSPLSIIAEIGVNHNGSVTKAKKLIRCAAEAGADYAKFQTFRADKLASPTAPVAGYQKRSFTGANQVDLLSGYELSEQAFLELLACCGEHNIGFLTTAHDLVSAEFVFSLESDFVKVPSGDITNLPFLRIVGGQSTPVLLSTGASTFEEVDAAVQTLLSAGLPPGKLTVLQCTSQYPAPDDEANLLAMVSYGEKFGTQIGYSDHTEGFHAAEVAVALGAVVIEKHLTLDRTMSGPDHAASMEPDAFGEMVTRLRRVGRVRGSSKKVLTSSEASNQQLIRKSIVASRTIEPGEVFTSDNLTVMRPGTGLNPMKWDELIGRNATRRYMAAEMIELH